jgi:hypothetical protein
VPGEVVEVGEGVVRSFTTEVTPAGWPRDEETRLEPAVGPRPFGDAFDVLFGGGGFRRFV